MSHARILWRRFAERDLRRAGELRKRVRLVLRLSRDRLSPGAAGEVAAAFAELELCWRGGVTGAPLTEALAKTAAAAAQQLPRYRKPWLQEGGEMVLLALIIILAVRTFAVQPMRIPTGSMQPTLYGVAAEDLRHRPEVGLPAGLKAWLERWVHGRHYYHFVAQTEGRLNRVEPPEPILPFLAGLPILKKQRFQVGTTWYTLWLPPVDLPNPYGMNPDHLFFAHAGVRPGRVYRPGQDIIRLRVITGDHILVDRLSYNFRPPRRGEIVVFRTSGIPRLADRTHYLKRLVAVGGERVRIGNDRHVVVNGARLDGATPGFANVYSFTGPPAESVYSGHVNDSLARQWRQPPGSLAPLFPNESAELVVRPRHFFVLGDNTLNSADGRIWGDLPCQNVIGRFWLTHWPFTERFGWGQE